MAKKRYIHFLFLILITLEFCWSDETQEKYEEWLNALQQESIYTTTTFGFLSFCGFSVPTLFRLRLLELARSLAAPLNQFSVILQDEHGTERIVQATELLSDGSTVLGLLYREREGFRIFDLGAVVWIYDNSNRLVGTGSQAVINNYLQILAHSSRYSSRYGRRDNSTITSPPMPSSTTNFLNQYPQYSNLKGNIKQLPILSHINLIFSTNSQGFRIPYQLLDNSNQRLPSYPLLNYNQMYIIHIRGGSEIHLRDDSGGFEFYFERDFYPDASTLVSRRQLGPKCILCTRNLVDKVNKVKVVGRGAHARHSYCLACQLNPFIDTCWLDRNRLILTRYHYNPNSNASKQYFERNIECYTKEIVHLNLLMTSQRHSPSLPPPIWTVEEAVPIVRFRHENNEENECSEAARSPIVWEHGIASDLDERTENPDKFHLLVNHHSVVGHLVATSDLPECDQHVVATSDLPECDQHDHNIEPLSMAACPSPSGRGNWAPHVDSYARELFNQVEFCRMYLTWRSLLPKLHKELLKSHADYRERKTHLFRNDLLSEDQGIYLLTSLFLEPVESFVRRLESDSVYDQKQADNVELPSDYFNSIDFFLDVFAYCLVIYYLSFWCF